MNICKYMYVRIRVYVWVNVCKHVCMSDEGVCVSERVYISMCLC